MSRPCLTACTRVVMWAASAAVAALYSCWLAGLKFNLTGSMPVGVYRLARTPPKRGEIVLACLPVAVAEFAKARGYVHRGNCPGDTAPVGKPILAVEGDFVFVSANGLEITGQPVPNSKALQRDSHGRLLPRLAPGLYRVRPKELWVVSSHSPLSFDSRYFGPISISLLVGIARPVWTR